MGFLNKVGSFLKREAKDLGDAAEDVKDQLDEELARREAELTMTPADKISAIQREAAETDARFEAIAERASGRGAKAGAAREIAEIDPNLELPNVTHIVLPDGRVKSGNGVPVFNEASSAPTVAAPPTGAPVGPSNLPPPRPPANLDPPPAQPSSGPSAAAPPPAAETLPAPPAAATSAEDLPPPPTAPAESPGPERSAPAASLPSRLPSPRPPAHIESHDYGKTPAQIKYERARAAANELLDELRGELKGEGEI